MAFFQIDLHAHTTASDGTYTPAALVELAAGRGLMILGVADRVPVDADLNRLNPYN